MLLLNTCLLNTLLACFLKLRMFRYTSLYSALCSINALICFAFKHSLWIFVEDTTQRFISVFLSSSQLALITLIILLFFFHFYLRKPGVTEFFFLSPVVPQMLANVCWSKCKRWPPTQRRVRAHLGTVLKLKLKSYRKSKQSQTCIYGGCIEK